MTDTGLKRTCILCEDAYCELRGEIHIDSSKNKKEVVGCTMHQTNKIPEYMKC
jgi:hypothetical protein